MSQNKWFHLACYYFGDGGEGWTLLRIVYEHRGVRYGYYIKGWPIFTEDLNETGQVKITQTGRVLTRRNDWSWKDTFQPYIRRSPVAKEYWEAEDVKIDWCAREEVIDSDSE